MGDRDPKSEALLRLKQWLEAGRRLRVRDTAKRLGVTRRTFQRYIAALQKLGVPLVYEEAANREREYYIPFERKRLRLEITEAQVVALNVALGWLDQFEGNVLFESLQGLRGRVSAWLAEHTEVEGERWFSQKFFALPFLPYRYRDEGDAFNDVVTALLQQKKLSFGYRSISSSGKRPRRHRVLPYTLVFYKGGFHLLAVREEVADWGDPTSFLLARMTGTKVLRDAPYDYPEDWDPAEVFEHKTGMMPGRVDRVEARFDARFFDYLKKERVWPRGTKIQRKDDQVHFAARLELNDELITWFLGFGPGVEVLGPDWFRDQLVEKACATAALYSTGDG